MNNIHKIRKVVKLNNPIVTENGTAIIQKNDNYGMAYLEDKGEIPEVSQADAVKDTIVEQVEDMIVEDKNVSEKEPPIQDNIVNSVEKEINNEITRQQVENKNRLQRNFWLVIIAVAVVIFYLNNR